VLLQLRTICDAIAQNDLRDIFSEMVMKLIEPLIMVRLGAGDQRHVAPFFEGLVTEFVESTTVSAPAIDDVARRSFARVVVVAHHCFLLAARR
jgi:hypothetical protein